MHTHLPHTFNTILKSKQTLTIQSQGNDQALHYLAQLLAQAEGSRSGEPPSPRRGLEKGKSSLTRDLA